MRRTLLFCGIVLAGIVAAVLVLREDRNGAPDAVAGVATIYVECSVYYRRTADVLVGENDPDTAQQYSDRAALALDAGAALSGENAMDLLKERNRQVSTMSRQQSELAELAGRYDDQCLTLLDD